MFISIHIKTWPPSEDGTTRLIPKATRDAEEVDFHAAFIAQSAERFLKDLSFDRNLCHLLCLLYHCKN